MREIILCKYGELILKGDNRVYFEKILLRELRKRLTRYGEFEVYQSQSTIYINPMQENVTIDVVVAAVQKVFGLVGITRAAEVEKDMDIILKAAQEYLPPFLDGAKTFKVDARRSDKRFPLQSPAIAAEVGGVLLDVMPQLKVDVNHPEQSVRIEIRDRMAYIHAGQLAGAGGMPVGCNGKGLLLLSGGIDSPVAGYMMAKRGVTVEALHFESSPYTSERAKEKVMALAGKLTEYCSKIKVHVISLTHIQEELMRNCEEDYFTLLLRRYMMRLAERTARQYGCGALITGESLGQVASQTMQAIGVTDAVVDMPIFRPCIGMDKEEIVTIARKIDTFETSILPFEDCCTVFTPKHPRTKPELEKVLIQEKKLDVDALLEEAFGTLSTIEIKLSDFDR